MGNLTKNYWISQLASASSWGSGYNDGLNVGWLRNSVDNKHQDWVSRISFQSDNLTWKDINYITVTIPGVSVVTQDVDSLLISTTRYNDCIAFVTSQNLAPKEVKPFILNAVAEQQIPIGISEGQYNSNSRALTFNLNALRQISPNTTNYIYFYTRTTNPRTWFETSINNANNIQVNSNIKSFTVSINDDDEGIFSVSGAGTYSVGSSVTITATTKTGFSFNKWTGYKTSTSSSFTFTMPQANVSFTASSTRNVYTNTIQHWRYIRSGGNNVPGTMKRYENEDTVFTSAYGLEATIPTNQIKNYTGFFNTGVANSHSWSWQPKNIGTKFTQPANNVTIEYYYYPNTVTIFDDATNKQTYEIRIYNDEKKSWELYSPFIYNGTSWVPYNSK